MRRISVQVESKLEFQLEAAARDQGVRPSAIVRQALEEYLRTRTSPPNARQVAEQLGILGAYPGLPADLSTNPKYMEGFGE